MSLAVILIIAGLVISFGAFVFVTINMFRRVTNRDSSSRLDSLFKRHIGAMIVMAFGVLLLIAGIIIIIGLDISNRFTK